MYCGNCGSDIPDGSKFCPKCGAKMTYDQQGTQTAAEGPTGGGPGRKLSNRTIGIIVAAAVVVVVAVVLIIVLSNGKPTINLNNYLTITEEGYDGYGTASYKIDRDKLEADYAGKIKLSSAGENSLLMSTAVKYGGDPVGLITESISGSLSDVSGLSNGDQITFTWDVDSEVEIYLNVKLKYRNETVTVKDLETAETFDAFNGVSVVFDGTAPDGTATVTSDGKLSSYEFAVEPSYGLSNGDTVTVSLADSESYYIEMYGGIPAETEREYTVEGLSYYVTELSQIPDDAMEKMQQQASDAFYAHVASAWNATYEEANGFNLLGHYFLTPKEGFSGDENIVYLVYQVDVINHAKTESDANEDQSFTYFTYYAFSNGIMLADGTFSMNYSNYSTCTDKINITIPDGKQEHSLFYYGYSDLDTLFNQVVTTRIEKYSYETDFNTNDDEGKPSEEGNGETSE